MRERMFPQESDGAPRPVLRAPDEAGADGIVEDVFEGGGVVVFVVDDPRGEALREEGALAAEAGVVFPGVVALEPLHSG
jgi:hypothetical protein